RVLDQALDRHSDALLHLVAHDATDRRAVSRFIRGFCCAHVSLSRSFFARSCCRVFKRAIDLRTLACWSGFAPWPVAACIRKLNCSRRSFSSSSASSASDFSRNAFLCSLTFISLLAVQRSWCR